MSKLTTICTYCSGAVAIKLEDFTTKRRGAVLTQYKCPHCDSKCEIYFAQRRKSRGKRFKQLELAREAALSERVAVAQRANDIVAKQLLAQPGCTCGASKSNQYEMRGDGLREGGHDGRVPLAPRHRFSCKWQGSDEEQAIRDARDAVLDVMGGAA